MRDISNISGKPHSYFGKIEQGIRGLDILELLELCQWLGIDYRSAINQINKL
ncbi:DNA-binding protein [Rheinheimera nanhaiensis]|nr:DNA-binding protein [Rheinheimera nanhaiensis]